MKTKHRTRGSREAAASRKTGRQTASPSFAASFPDTLQGAFPHTLQGALQAGATPARPVPWHTSLLQKAFPGKTGRPPQPSQPPLLTRAFAWLQTRAALTPNKRLRVCETASLGEKRFVAIVRVEGREFLIGGGAAGVSLLTQLGAAATPVVAMAEGCAE
jgi:hypothetical protein